MTMYVLSTHDDTSSDTSNSKATMTTMTTTDALSFPWPNTSPIAVLDLTHYTLTRLHPNLTRHQLHQLSRLFDGPQYVAFDTTEYEPADFGIPDFYHWTVELGFGREQLSTFTRPLEAVEVWKSEHGMPYADNDSVSRAFEHAMQEAHSDNPAQLDAIAQDRQTIAERFADYCISLTLDGDLHPAQTEAYTYTGARFAR